VPSAHLSEARIRELLLPFDVELGSHALGQLQTYLELLLRWNRKINLTSIYDPEECITRHFGESLYVSRHECLSGHLVDLGSGAGFPGLALKLVFPELQETLLEPVGKKRAFLKEVARCCGMAGVDVRAERVQGVAGIARRFDAVTSRGVGNIERHLLAIDSSLNVSGRVFFWTTRAHAGPLPSPGILWTGHYAIPVSRDRIILHGTKERST
jgi:16S rRNA (guanine(527)-N(7))-methyltransferase RsmG